MNQLLTPEDVADLLQMSVKTVYAHSKRLGGFRPAGIRMIRFKPEVIRDIMEGQGERLEVPVPAPGGAIQQPTFPDKGGSVRRNVRTKKVIEINGWKTDPSRHGL